MPDILAIYIFECTYNMCNSSKSEVILKNFIHLKPQKGLTSIYKNCRFRLPDIKNESTSKFN